jgi:hypothetical protein
MKIGMLWFDNDSTTDLAAKVLRAAAHYRRKYGQQPNQCFVNTEALPQGEVQVGGIVVRPSSTVLPHHFWMGEAESSWRTGETDHV